MGIIKRLLGICSTRKPADAGSWRHESGQVVVDLSRAPELAAPYGGLRLEAGTLPDRILVFNSGGDSYAAIFNRCTHMGRRIDPVDSRQPLRCCSISGSAYDRDGRVMAGPAKEPLKLLPMEKSGDRLYISLEE
jgi:nitrite reductase/ring-hydroxylating ferredoxin subunit